ncbi:MAG: histidine kinase [Opitutus sp.]|nr:histidine kinase [Opitutus sp.]
MNSTRTVPNRDSRPPNADAPRPDSPAPGGLRDGWMRVIGIPFFGLVIPRVTGLLGKLEWTDADYWLGTGWFIVTAGLIWEGNRWLLFKQRTHLDWFQRPILKLLLLVAANIVYTTPVSIASCWLWLRYLGAPFFTLNWAQINFATASVVVAVVFVTHAYETVFLIRERRDDQLRFEREARARVEAELETMKAQLAPHFLFNCLNTLAALIEREPTSAAAFNQHLADVCRYLLLQKNRDLVPLREELDFFRSYVELTRLRFPRSIDVRLTGFDTEDAAAQLIPPASLQLLLENAIKHNQFDEAHPLPVELTFRDSAIVVLNPLRPKNWQPPSTGIGLQNLRERVQLTTGGTIQVNTVGGHFSVRLPVVRAQTQPARESRE